MLFYASEAGEPAATLLIVAYAYEGGNLNRPELREPLRRLKKIVETEEDQRAMIQQALILIHYGDVEEGQKMLEAATRAESENPFSKIFDSYDDRVVKRMAYFSQDPLGRLDSARAWRELAIVRLNAGEYTGAMEAFRKAALELDDPLAYSYLASDEEHKGRKYSSKWVEYSIKAASGGHAESAYALAKMYSLPRRQIPKEVKDGSVRRDIYNPSRRVEIGLNLIFSWWSTKFLYPTRWGTEENRMEWALDWLLVGMYQTHPDSRFERAKLRWSLGTDLDLFWAVADLLLMGTERRGFFENSPNMMARIQAQLREWTATERGLKGLKKVKENGQIPIPTSLAKLIQSEEANPKG
jgi:tetratricopeptide (TPR) repeat protein